MGLLSAPLPVQGLAQQRWDKAAVGLAGLVVGLPVVVHQTVATLPTLLLRFTACLVQGGTVGHLGKGISEEGEKGGRKEGGRSAKEIKEE